MRDGTRTRVRWMGMIAGFAFGFAVSALAAESPPSTAGAESESTEAEDPVAEEQVAGDDVPCEEVVQDDLAGEQVAQTEKPKPRSITQEQKDRRRAASPKSPKEQDQAEPTTAENLVPPDGAVPRRPRVQQASPAGDAEAAEPPTIDRLRSLMASLDPQTFNSLVGADIDVQVVGGQVILNGPKEAVEKLELLLKLIGETTERKEFELVQVYKRDANEIAKSVEPQFKKVFRDPNRPPEDDLSVSALSPNLILVTALPDQIDVIIDTIHRIDELEEPIGKIQQLVFQLKNRRAGEVAEQLKKILQQIGQKRGATGAKSEVQVIPNNANNSLMVIAPESEREMLQKLINELDVAPAKGWSEVKLTVFPLIHSKASELAEVINKLIAAQAGAKDKAATEEVIQRLMISRALPSGEMVELPPIDLQKPSKILPDPGTNSLIVATVEENVGPLGELIRLLDGVPLGTDVSVKLFPLRYADVESVSDTLKNMFESGKKLGEDPDGSGKESVPAVPVGKALVYNVGLAKDTRTNTMIVSGRPEQLELVEKIVSELDKPVSSLKFPLRLIPLEYTDAAHVSKMLTELFDKRKEMIDASGAKGTAKERERVFLSVHIRTNSLIVSASEENVAEIQSIVKQLDSKPAKAFDQIRIVRCEKLSAEELKKKIEELWKRKSAIRKEGKLLEDTPVIAVDGRSNSLIVASSLEDFDDIKTLIAALETQPRLEGLELFRLQYADSKAVAEMLKELSKAFEGGSEGAKAPTVLADPRSNAIVAAGSRDMLERVADVVKRLDVQSGPMTAVFKVYPLQHGSASKLAPRIQELFDSRAKGEDSKKTPVVLLPDETSNSLVCSASRDDHEIIVDLMGLLDRPSNLARQFQIFPLKLAKAKNVADSLEKLFKTQGEKSGGRADAISVVADERTNAVIVWASSSEMVNIAEVLNRLDTSSPVVDMMIRVIQLRQALAEDFAKLLDEVLMGEGGGGDEKAVIVSFLEKDERGRDAVRKLLRQDIKIKPDPRTNSLMVMAPSDSMAMLEAMIRDFDRIRPITSEIRLFKLENSDAETMVKQLEELFKPKEGGGEGKTQSQLVFGGEKYKDKDLATVGQELRFAADPRTNTLIVAGSPIYLTMAEDLVTYLDSQEAEDRITEVYQAKSVPATDLATAVKSFNDQEKEALGDGEDQESKLRRAERQVSVEAVGDEEKGSSSLMVGTSRRAYQKTMEMISQLDRPEPQVMISVVIAEVTLNDRAELGVEIAGQDLDFSERAVLGPNGIVQGGGFDYVTGTDLGAAGLGIGGFNFTLSGEDLGFLFHALQQNDRLEVLSRPILMARNGQEGQIKIADQVPIVESTRLNDTGQTQSTIGREDVGIVLTATPHISPDGYVTIELKQEISNISGENLQLTEGVSSPVFATREVKTNVTVRDGETVVIGGLIQTRESEGENKVPILGDIPILGNLLRTTRSSKARTELLLALTADVLRSDVEVREMSVAEMDRFELPQSISTNPLMGKLRVTPEEAAMGPKSKTISPRETPDRGHAPPSDAQEPVPSAPPKPRTYGPEVPRSTSTTSTANARVYGPVVSRPAPEEHPEP